MIEIADGAINLVAGLDKMDLLLREEIGTVEENTGTITVEDTKTSTLPSYKQTGTQLLILLTVIGTVVTGIVLYRKVGLHLMQKLDYDEYSEIKKREEGQGGIIQNTVSVQRYDGIGGEFGETARLVI